MVLCYVSVEIESKKSVSIEVRVVLHVFEGDPLDYDLSH